MSKYNNSRLKIQSLTSQKHMHYECAREMRCTRETAFQLSNSCVTTNSAPFSLFTAASQWAWFVNLSVCCAPVWDPPTHYRSHLRVRDLMCRWPPHWQASSQRASPTPGQAKGRGLSPSWLHGVYPSFQTYGVYPFPLFSEQIWYTVAFLLCDLGVGQQTEKGGCHGGVYSFFPGTPREYTPIGNEYVTN